MIDIKSILLPTDLSSNVEYAAEYAYAFAAQFGAELHLLHIVTDLTEHLPDPELYPEMRGQYMQQAQEHAATQLESWAEKTRQMGLKVTAVSQSGAAEAGILRYAKEHEIDMIVMGTHGHSGLAHLMLGSIAEKVVRKSPCPVMTVRPPDLKFEKP